MRREPPETGDPRADEAGFTLVEVLVAFALVAVGMVLALQVAGSTGIGLVRVAAADVVTDEAEGILALYVAAGPHRGIERGRFSNGDPWSLTATDLGPDLGWQRMPPLWRLRLTRGGPDGPVVLVTLVGGRSGG